VVGPVGSGKSTLFNLMLRLYEPEAGALYWQGQDIREIPLKELRTSIASVEQQIFLFSESIGQNISLGGSAISPEELTHLLRLVEFEDELKSLPQGTAAVLGERGINLSGGQKQRLALARALARKPSLLLLDDCFSAVDVDLEHKIIRNLLHSYSALSLVIATHRLGIMPFVDEVWVLNEGKLVTRGAHKDLLKSSALYGQLWEKSEEHLESERQTGLELQETL
jgi:ABC-type multidrug transport system fused ATPase/permease subunit